ncbi:MAG TPA: hypothetical protein PLZ42_01525 [Methanothrix sp.]|nr:hypothetical protein [Methanothrix sp.]
MASAEKDHLPSFIMSLIMSFIMSFIVNLIVNHLAKPPSEPFFISCLLSKIPASPGGRGYIP